MRDHPARQWDDQFEVPPRSEPALDEAGTAGEAADRLAIDSDWDRSEPMERRSGVAHVSHQFPAFQSACVCLGDDFQISGAAEVALDHGHTLHSDALAENIRTSPRDESL